MITPDGRGLVPEAIVALNQASFGLPGVSPLQAAEETAVLRNIRVAASHIAPDSPRTAAHEPDRGERAYPDTQVYANGAFKAGRRSHLDYGEYPGKLIQ